MKIIFNGHPLAGSAEALSLPALDESLNVISEDTRTFFFGFTTCAGRNRQKTSSKIVQHCHELEAALGELDSPEYHDIAVADLLLPLRQIRNLCGNKQISTWIGLSADDFSGISGTENALNKLHEDPYRSAPIVVVVPKTTPDVRD